MPISGVLSFFVFFIIGIHIGGAAFSAHSRFVASSNVGVLRRVFVAFGARWLAMGCMVLSLRDGDQMVWIDALHVSTSVVHFAAIWDWPFGKLVRSSVRVYAAFAVSALAYEWIALGNAVALPDAASIWRCFAEALEADRYWGLFGSRHVLILSAKVTLALKKRAGELRIETWPASRCAAAIVV